MKKPKSVQTTFSQYTIGGVKGEGGSGIVYEASDDEGNLVAIKALDPRKASKDKLKRFKNEFHFCSKNKHPNIITVLDHGLTDDGIPFFVMPLYDGSLRGLLGNIDLESAIRVIGEVLNGAEAAHKLGVVHRDIKPENILVRSEANDLVLADFGIAEFEEEDLYTAVETKDGTRLANFQYAAPEQRSRGQNIDHRADIYSLGLILNELFTGEIPYGTNFRKISDVTDGYPYLDAIVEKMLEQNPQSRFDSIEEIKRELIARDQEHVALQKLNELERTVIPTSEIDDPIILEPMRITDVDWEDDVLTISFNHTVNSTWQWALHNMGSYHSLMGKAPENFQFRENNGVISATSNEAQEIVDYFKQWIPRANQAYETRIKQDMAAEERRQREELQQRIQKEKERADVLQELKL